MSMHSAVRLQQHCNLLLLWSQGALPSQHCCEIVRDGMLLSLQSFLMRSDHTTAMSTWCLTMTQQLSMSAWPSSPTSSVGASQVCSLFHLPNFVTVCCFCIIVGHTVTGIADQLLPDESFMMQTGKCRTAEGRAHADLKQPPCFSPTMLYTLCILCNYTLSKLL